MIGKDLAELDALILLRRIMSGDKVVYMCKDRESAVKRFENVAFVAANIGSNYFGYFRQQLEIVHLQSGGTATFMGADIAQTPSNKFKLQGAHVISIDEEK